MISGPRPGRKARPQHRDVLPAEPEGREHPVAPPIKPPGSVREVRVVLNADVLDRLKKEDEEILIDLERKFQGRLSFRVNAKFHFEEFKLVNALTDEELS